MLATLDASTILERHKAAGCSVVMLINLQRRHADQPAGCSVTRLQLQHGHARRFQLATLDARRSTLDASTTLDARRAADQLQHGQLISLQPAACSLQRRHARRFYHARRSSVAN